MTEEQWRKRVHWAIRAGRKTAKTQRAVWAAAVAQSATRPSMEKSYAAYNDGLAFFVRQVDALSLCAKYACEEAGLDFDEMYQDILGTIEAINKNEEGT